MGQEERGGVLVHVVEIGAELDVGHAEGDLELAPAMGGRHQGHVGPGQRRVTEKTEPVTGKVGNHADQGCLLEIEEAPEAAGDVDGGQVAETESDALQHQGRGRVDGGFGADDVVV